MDMNFNQFYNSIFSNEEKFNPLFWNPYESWRNKWKNGDRVQGEKFFGSSTFLVFTTDAWHLFKMMFLLTMFLSVVLYNPLVNIYIDFLIIPVVWFAGFELTLKLLKK